MSNRRRNRKPKLARKMRAVVDGERAILIDRRGRPAGVVRTADLKDRAVDAARIQPPGLDGTFRDGCVACMRPTDTAVALEGCMGFMTAVLSAWGIPEGSVAPLMFEGRTKDDQITALVDDAGRVIGVQMGFQVCADCAGRAHMVPGLDIGAGSELPLYRERDLPGSDECSHDGLGEAP